MGSLLRAVTIALCITALRGGAAIDELGEAWITEPKSGSVVEGPVVDVEIGLRRGSATAGATSACISAARVVDGDPLPGDDRWPSAECSDVSLPSFHDDAKPLVARVALDLRPPGWYRVDVVLRGGPAGDADAPAISEFAVAVFVAGAAAPAADRSRLLGLASTATRSRRAAADAEPSVLAAAAERLASRGRNASALDFPVVHALGRWGVNGSLGSMDEALWSATRNVGILFAETLDWSQSDLAALRRFDALLVGSTWCGAGLKAAAAALDGAPLPPVKAFMQGVDASLFKPPTGVRRNPGARFRVFSGGKLEWRKGQDIVVAAFREFRRRHPDADAELVVAWANPWRKTVLTMANATHTAGVPAATRQQVLEANATAPLPRTDADYVDENAALLDWLEANGLDRRDVVPLIPVHHRYVPQILRAVDAALFPNRAEGGTNLVAMEAVAMGVPTALARNTGQADLVDFLGGDDGCWPLGNQVESPAARAAPDQFAGYETDPGDAAAALADIYRDRAAARRRALRGAKRMRAWSWESAVEVLADAAFG
ncbi:hypothetical protein JL722_10325 [Aureococcus anophagefferens]|nr:hypothetical protein JL722_10325 [Aureococcus anophagefferens]